MGERTDKVSTLHLKAAWTPADMGSPHCAGATCPRATAKTAGAAATGDIQPSTDNIIIIISIRLPASQHPAPNRLYL